MKKRILLFEDDYETMHVVKEYLDEVHGFYVELSAADSLSTRLSQEYFDLIIVDIMIKPNSLDAHGMLVKNLHFEGVNWQKTGLEFLKRLRKGEFTQNPNSGTQSNTPVILLSAIADSSFVKELQNDRVPDVFYLEKPFRLEELVSLINKSLQG